MSTGTAPPARVQRRRTRGYRLQLAAPGARCVDRTTRYGNPFTLTDATADDPTPTVEQARALCARRYAQWLDGEITLTDPALTARRQWILDHLPELAGHPLACYCPLPAPGADDHCHAAHLIDLANRPAA